MVDTSPNYWKPPAKLILLNISIRILLHNILIRFKTFSTLTSVVWTPLSYLLYYNFWFCVYLFWFGRGNALKCVLAPGLFGPFLFQHDSVPVHTVNSIKKLFSYLVDSLKQEWRML